MFRPIESVESIGRVRKTDAAGQKCPFRFVDSDPVVANFKVETTLRTAGGDVDMNSAGKWFDAVTNGIFNQRLKDQLRYKRIIESALDIHADQKFVFETSAHDVEIEFKKMQLFGEANFLSRRTGNCEAQELAQARNHLIGCAHVFVHRCGDGVKRIEEEVRLKLEAQILQLRLC